MIPIDDANPTHRAPVVTLLLIAACVGAFVWWIGLEAWEQQWSIHSLGLIPAVVFGRMTLDPYIPDLPPGAPFLTHLFLHGGWIHLAGNMLYLWIFGNNVEDRLGHGRFLLFYLMAGVAGSAVFVALNPDSTVPMVGASGAISGVLGAYLLLYPMARVRMIVPPLFFRTFTVPVWAFLGFWILLQSVNLTADLALDAAATPRTDEGGVAWAAHLAGFLIGMVLLLVLRPKGVRLLQRPNQPRMRARNDKGERGEITRARPEKGPWASPAPAPARHAASMAEAVSDTSRQVKAHRQKATAIVARPAATVSGAAARRGGAIVQR